VNRRPGPIIVTFKKAFRYNRKIATLWIYGRKMISVLLTYCLQTGYDGIFFDNIQTLPLEFLVKKSFAITKILGLANVSSIKQQM